MSWTDDEKRIVLERYDCEYCPAKRGEWCMTKSGNKATWLHGNRGRELSNYTWAVYEEGEKAGKFFAERKAQVIIDRQVAEIHELRRKVNELNNFQSRWVGG